MIRIDEFSEASDIDGSLSTEEQTRFLTFGFDITLDELILILWSELYSFESKITLTTTFNSHITIKKTYGSDISTLLTKNSTVVERGYADE